MRADTADEVVEHGTRTSVQGDRVRVRRLPPSAARCMPRFTMWRNWRIAFQRRRRTTSPKRSSSRRRTRSTGKATANPGQCQSCHRRIFEDWAGSMMANAWRDPAWRGAFLLAARQSSTDGDCEAPSPPDGTARARLNPFASPASAHRPSTSAQRPTACRARARSSTASARAATCRATTWTTCRSTTSPPIARPDWSTRGWPPTSIPPRTPAPESRSRRTSASSATPSRGRRASSAPSATASPTRATRRTTTLARAGSPHHPEYVPARGTASRAQLVPERQDIFDVPDPSSPNLGYAVGAGSFRLSPHAIGFPDRFGPLAATRARTAGRLPRGRVPKDDAVRAGGREQAPRLSRGAPDAIGAVRRLPRRDESADDQEPPRQMGRRVSDRTHLHRVARQPVRRSTRQSQLRSRLQARLPDLSHAAGLRPAGNGAEPLSRRRAAAAAARRGRRSTGPSAATSATTSSAATPTCRA